MNQKRTSSAVFLLLAIAIVLPCAAYLLWTFTDILPRVGSVTEHGTVRAYHIDGHTCYQTLIRNDEEVLYRSELYAEMPYLFEQENSVFLIEREESGNSISGFDLESGEWTEASDDILSYGFLNPFSHVENIHVVPQKTDIRYAKFYDLSDEDEPHWYWIVKDVKGEILWREESETSPEVQGDNQSFTIFYTQEGIPLCMEFDPVNSEWSHDYAVFENGAVYVEQLIDRIQTEDYNGTDQIVQESGFVNTEPSEEIVGCNAAYLRAKDEVNIPYDLVTFKGQVGDGNISRWMVTFSRKKDPDAMTQSVFMDDHGVTLLILRSKKEKG